MNPFISKIPIRSALALLMMFISLDSILAQDTNSTASTNAPRVETTNTTKVIPTAAQADTNATVKTAGADATNTVAAASTNAVSSGYDIKSFEAISQKSIFNPNRSARRSDSRSEPVKPKRVDSFSLVGTVSYDKGIFAVFDGSSYEYRKNLKVSDKIAGYSIDEIGQDYAILGAASNKTLRLPVGGQLRRTEGEKWIYRPPAEAAPEVAASDSTSSSSVTNSTDSSSSGSGDKPTVPTAVESDIMKRLMAKRLAEK